jgi:hypothetical protein
MLFVHQTTSRRYALFTSATVGEVRRLTERQRYELWQAAAAADAAADDAVPHQTVAMQLSTFAAWDCQTSDIQLIASCLSDVADYDGRHLNGLATMMATDGNRNHVSAAT